MRTRSIVLLTFSLSILLGCSTNPVTKKPEMSFIGPAEEIELGQNYYEPMQQSAGGIYDLDPELTKYVQSIITVLGGVSDRPELPYEIVILDSDAVNAWALPGGKMAIHRGLLQEVSNEAELAAVLGHEMVHAAARHSARQMERGTLLLAGLAIADAALGNNENRTLILAGASIGTQLVSLKYSRMDESEADHYGMVYMERAGYDPQQAVTLQETFVRLFETREPGIFGQMFASHPPSHDRVAANQALADTMAKDLFVGQGAYEKATQQLRAQAPGYNIAAQGLEAYMEEDYTTAEQLGQDAIDKAPEIYQGYFIKGLVAQEASLHSQALIYYNNAITRHSKYFLLYYHRAQVHEALSNFDAAKADLIASIELLPTPEASDALKRIKRLERQQERRARAQKK